MPAVPEKTPRRKRRVLLWFFVMLLLVSGGAGAWLALGRPSIGVLTKADPYGPPSDPLTYWLVVGPFPAKNGADLDTAHEPEKPTRDLTATLKGAKGPLKWKLAKMQRNLISFDRELGVHATCNGYGLTYIECPVETKATLGIGSDDAVRLSLNGEKVHENRTQRGCAVDQDRATVTLRAGVNEILIKIGQGTGEWGFAVTIRALDGKPLTGLKGRLPKEIAIPEPAKPPETPAPRTAPTKK